MPPAPPLALPSLAEIHDARQRIAGIAVETPLVRLDGGRAGVETWLKLENAQPILREFGFRAVLFVVTNALGRDNFWHDPSSETRIPTGCT